MILIAVLYFSFFIHDVDSGVIYEGPASSLHRLYMGLFCYEVWGSWTEALGAKVFSSVAFCVVDWSAMLPYTRIAFSIFVDFFPSSSS